MARLYRFLTAPAGESHVNILLALTVFLLSAMSVALVWQAQIISQQRDIIRWLEHGKMTF